jgi:hypothetical protein
MEELDTQLKTAADALWGYRDQHGKWTAGLSQRVAAIENKQNLSLGLIALSLARLVGPDLANLLVSAAKASGFH